MDAQAVLFKNNDKLEATTYLNVSRYIKFYLLFDLTYKDDESIKEIENFDEISELKSEEKDSSNSVNLQFEENKSLVKINDTP